MKKENGYVSLAVIMGVVVIFVSILAVNFEKLITLQQTVKSQYKIGDSMYINGLNITGKINQITAYDPIRINLLVVGTNGMPAIIENVDIRNLTKIQTIEK